MQVEVRVPYYLYLLINIYRMEGGELFNRIQEKKSFTEKGKQNYPKYFCVKIVIF